MIPAKTRPASSSEGPSAAEPDPRQRTALILIDGKRSLARAFGGRNSRDIERLFALELVHGSLLRKQRRSRAARRNADGEADLRLAAGALCLAYPIASRLTAGLGLRASASTSRRGGPGYEDLLRCRRIREAVGADKFAPLALALGQR
jgi:hypothetical protein